MKVRSDAEAVAQMNDSPFRTHRGRCGRAMRFAAVTFGEQVQTGTGS